MEREGIQKWSGEAFKSGVGGVQKSGAGSCTLHSRHKAGWDSLLINQSINQLGDIEWGCQNLEHVVLPRPIPKPIQVWRMVQALAYLLPTYMYIQFSAKVSRRLAGTGLRHFSGSKGVK